MANLPESPEWTAGVYQIERNDLVGGGPDGTANKPLRDLANRTRWLYQKFNTAFDGLGWIQLGIWEIGLEISLPTQIVNYQGSWYRYAGNLDEPHVISGASPYDDGNWINVNVNVGDVAMWRCGATKRAGRTYRVFNGRWPASHSSHVGQCKNI